MLMTMFRLFLHEATMRLMAGASPNKTQELLARSRDSGSRVTQRSDYICVTCDIT